MKDNDGDVDDDDENDVHQHYNIVINYVIMTSQCAQCTSKIHTIKKTGILTIVILCRYNNCNICPETNTYITTW